MLDAYVVQKPIFTMTKETFGYSFYYKNLNSSALNPTVHTAEDKVVFASVFAAMDRKALFGEYHSFLLFQDYLTEEKYAAQIQPENTILVFLCEKLQNEDYVEKIQEMRDRGFTTLTQISTPEQLPSAMMQLFDVIAVDLCTEDKKMEARLCMLVKDNDKVLLGLNVHDQAAFTRARRLLCDLFSGKLYAKAPTEALVPTLYPSQLSFLKMMELQDKLDPEFDEYIRILDNDVSIAYRLLLHVNTVEYYRGKEVTSIRSAAVTLGLESLKEWIYLSCFQSPHYTQNDEIVRLSLVRAKFLEELAPFVPAIGRNSDQLHLMGMLASIDVIMNTSMEKVLEGLHIEEDIQDALAHRIGRLGMLLDLLYAYESADWQAVREIEQKLNIGKGNIIRSYLLALRYVNELWDSVSAKPT